MLKTLMLWSGTAVSWSVLRGDWETRVMSCAGWHEQDRSISSAASAKCLQISWGSHCIADEPRQRVRAQQLSHRIWLSDCRSGLKWAPFATIAILTSPAAAQHQLAEPNPQCGLGFTTSCASGFCPLLLSIGEQLRGCPCKGLRENWHSLQTR